MWYIVIGICVVLLGLWFFWPSKSTPGTGSGSGGGTPDPENGDGTQNQ